MKEELLQLKQKLRKKIMPEHLQKMEELSKSEDPLGYIALNNAIDRLIEKKRLEEEQNLLKKKKSIVLDDKVDEFIKWYTNNIVKENYIDIGEYSRPIEMRNFIEKMAVWYELRYPEYEINRIMPGSSQEMIDVSDVMFKNNRYINDLLEEDSDVRELDWDEFYNTKAFVNSLPWNEKCFLLSPRYHDIVYWNRSHSSAHLHLTKKGVIIEAENMELVLPDLSNQDLKGKHLKELIQILKEKEIRIPLYSEFESAIKDYENAVYQKEEMLNCVMYRIIERGGNRIGPRRAFLFAKEFGRNIDIPMMYGVDRTDPGLRLFMNEYIKAGGSKELVCYVNYFSRASKYEKLNTITIHELIKTQGNNATTFYTPEEDELHQRFLNALVSQVDQESVTKEEVKRLRLERKLKRAKQREK